MKQSEKQLLLNRYEELQDETNRLYDQGSPALETAKCEAKEELMEEIMAALNIEFKEVGDE